MSIIWTREENVKRKYLAARTVALGLALAFAGVAFAGQNAIKIAVINDQSGPFSAHGGPGTVAAVKLAVQDFGGTVLGKPIEVLAFDHQNKPDIATSLTTKLIDVDGVDVFVDGASSAATLAIQNVTRQRSKIFLITGGAASELTGKECSPTGFHLVPDTYSLARGIGIATVRTSGKNWFFITADYAFGAALEKDARSVIEPLGAKVLGSVEHPLNTADFSSFLLQAQASGADVVALADAGADLVTALKQAEEFHITDDGKTRLVAFLLDVPDIKSIGLQTAGGVQFVLPFYWDQDDSTRAWSKRFEEASGGQLPTRIHALSYAGVLHYLKAVQAAGTDDARVVAKLMHTTPMNDMLNKNVEIRADGRVMTDMLLLQAKSPAESTGPDDLMKIVSRVPANEVFKSLEDGGCPLDRR
jgi:branched-chain amino acid transport system substrate-binding protein